MGKLGKKARKFSKKNLQSVLKKQRKLKSMFKRRASKSKFFASSIVLITRFKCLIFAIYIYIYIYEIEPSGL